MMRLTIKRRIMLLYTILTTILLAILLPIVYGTVSASLSLDIQSRLSNAIAQVLITITKKSLYRLTAKTLFCFSCQEIRNHRQTQCFILSRKFLHNQIENFLLIRR